MLAFNEHILRNGYLRLFAFVAIVVYLAYFLVYSGNMEFIYRPSTMQLSWNQNEPLGYRSHFS